MLQSTTFQPFCPQSINNLQKRYPPSNVGCAMHLYQLLYHLRCPGIVLKVEIHHQLKLNRSLKFEENPSLVKIESIIKV